MTRIVLASGNQGKLREFAEMLAGLDLEVLPQSAFDVPEAKETGLTFVESTKVDRRGCWNIRQHANIHQSEERC